jgi:hypothetical protein
MVPPMDVKYVDVGRAKLFQGGFDGDVHRFNAVAGVIDLDGDGFTTGS